jgi:hypothetical protein
VREGVVEALELDLVGPWHEHEFADELLPGWVRPSNWYLTGFLIPADAPPEQSADDDADDEFDEVPESDGEEGDEDRGAAKKGFFPSSMGLSALVDGAATSLSVTVRWGDYEPGEHRSEQREEDDKPLPVWRRTPQEREITVPLVKGSGPPVVLPVPNSGGLELQLAERDIPAGGLSPGIPAGTRSVSLFLVNRRPAQKDRPDRAFVFQAELEVHCELPFVPRPDLRGALAEEWDEQVADLHYVDTPEFATGHGISTDWEIAGGECRMLRTRWLPSAEVERTETATIEGVELTMSALGALTDGAAVRAALDPLAAHYREWIDQRRAEAQSLPGKHRETAEELLRLAAVAAGRIERGIDVLASEGDPLDAFRVANRAVGAALERRPDIEQPAWRPFQLAFILINLPGINDPLDPHRETVDLLFFPTGGGKTEAYLGLAAFTLVLRRLHNPVDGGRGGAGVSVIMRYTLRLLTLDQLSRAASLVCALELERQKAPEAYGEWPFEIGLWVGKAATPNNLGEKGDKRTDTARSKVHQFKQNPSHRPSPIPLEDCPWCGHRFAPDSFNLLPDDDHPRELRIVCTNLECDFIGDQMLPIVAVDESLYRRLPAFLVATVDKFASLPWVAESGALLGGADRFDSHGFYGAGRPNVGTLLAAPVRPPDLVIQDELHLISGPLGTMAGLYETAIEGLCLRGAGAAIRPKIVASTATVRRAQDQVQALFGRPLTQVFPPPGPDRRDSFFAKTVPASESPARRYVGVAAQGRNPKVVMRKVWLALMGAAERAYRDAGGHKNLGNPADPYMTVLGYFNSLRELGGARRILEEEVRNTLKSYGERRRIGEHPGLFQDRRTFSEVVELTSRVPTDKVAEARRRLGTTFDKPDRVDCAIATNMISVGLDIQRLGLMGVLGQPKTAAEYIQATSRVGRSADAPGLVVTVLNVHKPRDRSHYERFRHFHETFYTAVEVASVTPFSARALDRGMVGAVLALARHLDPKLTPPSGAEHLQAARGPLEQHLLERFLGRVNAQPIDDDDERAQCATSVQSRIVDLLDSWQKISDDYHNVGVALQYQKYELDKPKPLMREMLDEDFESEHHRKFRVNRSLRDVEPSVNLFLKEQTGGFAKDGV